MDFRTISKFTQKGEALHFLAENNSRPEHAILSLATGVVSTDTITVNGKVYEILSVETSTGASTSGGDFNNTNAGPLTVTLTAHGVAQGAILRVESEYFRVDRVVDANTLIVSRGHFGSTIAAHADATTVFETATAPAAGTRTIPVQDIATLATLAADIKQGFDYHDDNTVVTEVVGTDVIFISSDEKYDLSVTEGLTGSSSVTSVAGVLKGTARGGVYAFTAGSATPRVVLPFSPTQVSALVFSSGASKAWDGAITVNGQVVDLGAGGLVDIASGDHVFLFAS